jgi:anaerobic dimethyl sulfoxide reductase subunit A
MPKHYMVQTLQNIPKQVQAAKKLDMIFTLTARQEDPTSRISDFIFPVTDDMELDPFFGPIFNGFVYNAKLIAAPGECKSPDWFNVQIAKKLGFINDYFATYNNYGEAKWDQMWKDMAKTAYEKWASAQDIKPLNPPSWEEFQKKPVFHYDMDSTPYFALGDEINKAKPFPTKTGKIHAYDDDLAKGSDYLKTTKYGGFVDPYPAYHPELQFGGYHDPDAKDRPLTLMTNNHPRYRVHSWNFRNPWLTNELFEHNIALSVPDAKARGINDGDMVRVVSDVGVTQLVASVSSRIIPGTCMSWYGVWWDPDPVTGIDHAGDPNAICTDRACAAKTYASMNRVQVGKL